MNISLSKAPIKSVRQALQEDKNIVLLGVGGSQHDNDWDTEITDLGGSGITLNSEQAKKWCTKIASTAGA